MPTNEATVVLLRHGETEWSLNGRHTGLSDIELTENGRNEAREAGKRLAGIEFDQVLTSPLKRARDTCELAGYGAGAQTTDELTEWNYGEYEGITTVEIQQTRPDWWLLPRATRGSVGGIGAEFGGISARRVSRSMCRGCRSMIRSNSYWPILRST